MVLLSMVKKREKTPSKRVNEKKNFKTRSDINIERALIDNFTALQRVMTNLSVKFDNLSDQISKLLNLFEISAKALAEKEVGTEKDKKDNKLILEKIDNILEQNKVIAKGITLIHDKNMPEESGEENLMPNLPMPPKRFQFPRKMNPEYEDSDSINLVGYQKSISSGEKTESII
jgi:hypothetical protein